jgi:hypothetical protein
VAWRKRNFFKEILTHGNCGLQKDVTASRRKITRCTGHGHMARNKDDVTPRSEKGRTFGKRPWKDPECNTTIRDRGLRQQLKGRNEVKDLGSGQPRYVKKPNLKEVQVTSTGNSDMNFTKTARLEIAKRIVGSSVGL